MKTIGLIAMIVIGMVASAAAQTNATLTLTWTYQPVAGDVVYSNVVERSVTTTSSWQVVKWVAHTDGTNSWRDTGLAANTTYWYRIRSWNPAGYGSYSTPAGAVTLTPPRGSIVVLSITGGTSQ